MAAPLAERGIAFRYTPAAADWLAAHAFGGKRGARDLRTLIRREAEDRIAALLVERYADPPTMLALDVKDDRLIAVTDKD